MPQLKAQRHLYRAYIPIYNALGAAGWRPIPYAHIGESAEQKSDPAKLAPWCERFGSADQGYFFAIRNPGPAAELTLSLDPKSLSLDKATFTAVTGCDVISTTPQTAVLKMPAQWTAVIAVNRPDAAALHERYQTEIAAFQADTADKR